MILELDFKLIESMLFNLYREFSDYFLGIGWT